MPPDLSLRHPPIHTPTATGVVSARQRPRGGRQRPRSAPAPNIVRRDTAVAVALALCFGALTGAVASGKTSAVDRRLRRRQRHPRHGGWHEIAVGVKVVAKPWVQLPVAAAVSHRLRRAGVPGARAAVVAAAGIFLADKACKRLVPRRRPPGYEGRETDQSFPSGHTASTAALTLTTARLLERAGVARLPIASVGAAIITALVAETRLALDEHWPSDVLAGALLGTAAAFAALAATGRAGRGRPSR